MALWSAAIPTWMGTAVADTADFTDNGHATIKGGTSTQRGLIQEVQMGGLAAVTSPSIMVFGRTSTVGATLTALRLAALDPATADLGTNPIHYAVSTTKPRRSATLGILLNLSFNAYGGAMRWLPAPGEEISYLGNTASFGELSLNHYTGGTPGLLSSHIIFETR